MSTTTQPKGAPCAHGIWPGVACGVCDLTKERDRYRDALYQLHGMIQIPAADWALIDVINRALVR